MRERERGFVKGGEVSVGNSEYRYLCVSVYIDVCVWSLMFKFVAMLNVISPSDR